MILMFLISGLAMQQFLLMLGGPILGAAAAIAVYRGLAPRED